MLAIDIIQRDFRHVSITSTVDEALRWMGKYKLKHLPIIKSKAFLSIISEETLLSVVPASKLGDLKNDGVRVYVSESDHILEVAKVMINEELTILPVLDQEDTYLGIINIVDLFEAIVEKYGFNTEGSLLVIEMSQQDFHLSELVRILEAERIHLFSILVSTENYLNVEITLKTDMKDINFILQTLERYSYRVKAYFQDDQYHHQLKDRYDSLLSYLNV